MKKPVIVIADDEAVLRMLAADYFDDAGYEVVEVSNGAEALAVLATRPDVLALFTDVQMPGRPDGVSVANQVRVLRPEMAIIVVSAHKSPSAEVLAPGIRFITKPYNGSVVVKMFDEMLAHGDGKAG